MRPLIVANWKMNPPTLKGAKLLFNSVKRGLKNIKNAEVIICPPFPYILNLKSKTLKEPVRAAWWRSGCSLKLGAQDCFWKMQGAFTGEVSPLMLKNLGCQYIIIGHSERRKYFGETDEMINKKIKAVLKVKLKPIFCIGETEDERERQETQKVLNSQIEKELKRISKQEIKNIIVAYEPIWAIGTGNPCDIDTARSMTLLIRKLIAQFYSRYIAENLLILYGGSVDSKNAPSYIKEARMDGLLVGGASLNSGEFLQIVKNVI